MDILSIIPARGGSKRIPKKNLLPLNDLPLIGHSISHSLGSKMINKTVVSTDSDEIIEFVADYKDVDIIKRPTEISGDSSTTEEVLKHTLERLLTNGYKPDIIILLQVTSPLRKPGIIDNALKKFISTKADSLLSVTKNHRFLWINKNNKPEPLNYDYNKRPMTQEMNDQFMENGSFYIFKPWLINEKNSRLGGKIELFEMDYWSSFEIDELEDYKLYQYIFQSYL